MQTNKDELKKILDKAIEDEINNRKEIENYAITAKKITEEEYFILFDVLEAHYLANYIMNQYSDDMYWLVRKIIFMHQLLKQEMTNTEIITNTVNTSLRHDFDQQEIMGICHEIVERMNGKDYLKEHSLNLISSNKGKGKRKILKINFDDEPLV